jgi:hypothetical protein
MRATYLIFRDVNALKYFMKNYESRRSKTEV